VISQSVIRTFAVAVPQVLVGKNFRQVVH